MKVRFLFILSIFAIIISCKPDLSNPKVESLYKEVMVIHDEVMPEISTIHKLKKSIKKKDNLNDTDLDLISELDEADESMMQWMSDFGAFRKMDKEDDQTKIQYLIGEKKKITKVSNDMKSAINKAQDYLKNN